MDRPRLATNPNEPLLHDIEVCGELLCQFRGADEFLPVYVQLGGGALSICAERAGGELISTARVPDLSRLLVRTPRTARAGRPHCLRVDLPDDEPDSRGVCKYIFDLGSAENLGKWQRGLCVRLSATQHALAGSGGNWWQDLKLNPLRGSKKPMNSTREQRTGWQKVSLNTPNKRGTKTGKLQTCSSIQDPLGAELRCKTLRGNSSRLKR